MKQTLAIIAVLSTILCTTTAGAEPRGAFSLAMREPRLAQSSTRLSDDEFMAAVEGSGKLRFTDVELGLKDNPKFRTAVGMRIAGIVITTVSLSAATAFGIVSLASYAQAQHSDKDEPWAFAAGFGMLAGISLVPSLVGVPLWVAGQSIINKMRAERRAALLPRISFAAAPNGAAIGARWQF